MTGTPATPQVLNTQILGLHPNVVPDGALYIGRHTRNGWACSKWHNPFRVGPDGDRAEVIRKYRAWVCDEPELMAALPELRGKDLICWCAPLACHGDVLLELARQERPASGQRLVKYDAACPGSSRSKVS